MRIWVWLEDIARKPAAGYAGLQDLHANRKRFDRRRLRDQEVFLKG